MSSLYPCSLKPASLQNEIQHWTGFGARVPAPSSCSVDWKSSFELGFGARIPAPRRSSVDWKSSADLGFRARVPAPSFRLGILFLEESREAMTELDLSAEVPFSYGLEHWHLIVSKCCESDTHRSFWFLACY